MNSHNTHADTYSTIPLKELTTAESLLLLCARLWKMQQACRASCPADWRGGLCAAGVAEVADDIMDPLLHILYGGGRLVDIPNLTCQRIQTVESHFLRCIALIQSQQLEAAEATLCQCLPARDLKAAIPLAKQLSYSFLLAKLYFPLRQATPNNYPINDK